MSDKIETSRPVDGAHSHLPPATQLAWRRHWETSLQPDEHAALAALLGRVFSLDTTSGDGVSWIGARPELRIVAWADHRPVAHAAIVRRFLRAADEARSVLVGDVGLVAVDPARRGQHLGDALMAEVAAALADLELAFGFLTCGAEVTAFYRRQRWHPTGQPLHAIGVHHHIETDRSNGMVLPVRHPLAEWPRGLLARDGREI